VDTDRGTGRLDTIELPAGGRRIDARTWVPTPATTQPPPGASPPAATLLINGPPAWMLTLTPTGSTTFVRRLPILASGTGGAVSFTAATGSYSLKVEDGAGHEATQTIDVPTAGLTLDVTPWLADQLRTSQGPTVAADATKGTLVLRGTPPRSFVRVGGLFDWTVDNTGRPVEFVLPAGTHGVTIIPPLGSAQRTASVVIVAGQRQDLLYGTMRTPSALETTETGIEPVEAMCGPVLNRAALPWAPPTACPGNELTAPDGTRWRALASTNGVTLMQLKADGTLAASNATGMGLGTKVLIVAVVAAGGYAAWSWWSNREKD
jgi:hypothetical protein